MRRSWAALLAALLAWPPLAAQAPPAEGVLASRVELVPHPGTAITHGERIYLGPMSVVGRPDGIGLVETVSPEDYLLGLREVPFSWHAEALKAQVVAARTYLAFTLAQGRSSAGRQYGYDICATSACQVYAGPLGIDGLYGDRWRAAVEQTAGEILLYDGAPAQALYSSTSGYRTRESEDIFLGLDLPYLAAVESPGEQSPFVTWTFAVSESNMQALLEHAGLVDGAVKNMVVQTTTDGAGPWMVVITSEGRSERVPTYQFRGFMNRAATALMPEVLPAQRRDGRRYPQTLLSGTYLIWRRLEVGIGTDGAKFLRDGSYVFSGWGWGHQVGMSQYGAQAMAEAGSSYDQILGHYYTGLEPVPAEDALPATVAVGLAVGVDEVVLSPDGPVDVVIDGVPVGEPTLGSWRFVTEGSLIRVVPPVGLGLPARVEQPRIRPSTLGDILLFAVTAPAEVVVSVSSQNREVGRLDLGGLDAGNHEVLLAEVVSEALSRRQRFYVIIEATNPEGSDRRTLVIVPEIR
ncbi:MAG TPA: SpoIID/LytB domain-containing protein [Acidimicrobiia bacterium]|nr:SpoIID/LytB domain-containing protein [Acidimicrobiia bacterium]